MSAVVRFHSNRAVEWEGVIHRLVSENVVSRLVGRDATLWGEAAASEASIRLGWLDHPDRARGLIEEVEEFRDALGSAGIDSVVLCGMGGSSLAPEVVSKRFQTDLTVVDSTHPDHLHAVLTPDVRNRVVVVSSKSGGTVETAAAMAVWENAFSSAGLSPGHHLVVVTDPGSPLEREARARGYRVFLANPEVGGRFSALTAFGIVPTVLSGVDMMEVVSEASLTLEALHDLGAGNPAVRLAAALATGRDVALLLPDPHSPGLGDWIEQLVAESTGKEGRGVLPVVAASAGASERQVGLTDVLVVDLSGADPDATGADISISAPLGAQFLLWEYATALLGYVLGINPFDQPDVESAKVATRALLDDPSPRLPADFVEGGIEVWNPPGVLSSSVRESFAALVSSLGPSGYLSLQLYIDRLKTTIPDEVRDGLVAALGRPVTVGYGPRFLHSTGQFHKGGTPDGVFLQIEQVAHVRIGIPGFPFDCGELIDAQSAGDRQVLTSRGRPVLTLRISADADVVEVVQGLVASQ